MDKIKNELTSNKNYIYMGYLITILTMLPQIIASPSLNESKHIIFLYITIFVLFLVMKFSKILFGIFIIYINLTNIIIGHIYIHWGYSGKIASRISILLESPQHERLEYLTTFINYKDVLLVIYTAIVLTLLYKFIVHFKHSFKVVKFLGFIFFITIISAINIYKSPLKNIEPFSLPYSFEKAIEFTTYPKLRVEYLNSLSEKIDKNKKMIYDSIVVIQGESVNKHHMGIYGYARETTPFFSSLKRDKNFFIFNAISPANLTRLSVPTLNTKATVANFLDAFMKSRSIVGDFKLYGYKTYWISSHANSGLYDTINSSMSNEADIIYFTNSEFSENNKTTDMELVKYLHSIKENNNSSPKMYFIHLLGSHFAYDKRFTEDKALIKNAKDTKDLYDNTIFYTDYILKNIFDYFKKDIEKGKKILFVYTSDHGEFIADGRAIGGHGSLSPFKDEYEIPFVLYSTIKNNRIDYIYEKNKKGYFNLENLNYIIEYISGIQDDANISYSPNVMASDAKNIYNYDNLKFFKTSN